MDTRQLNPEWPTYSQPMLDYDLMIVPEFFPETLPVAPTVRWVLYYPGKIGYGPLLYPEHEHVVIFYPEYRAAAEAAAPGRVVDEFMLPSCELPGLHDEGPPRDVPAAFWIGKAPEALHCPERAVTISRNWPSTRKDLVYLLRSVKRFYSCDSCTMLNYEAQLCGCEVFVWSVEKRIFAPWYAADADKFLPQTHEVQVARVAEFLKRCSKHFGLGEQ